MSYEPSEPSYGCPIVDEGIELFEQLRTKCEELRQWGQYYKDEHENMESEKDDAETRVAELEDEVTDLEDKVKELEERIEELEPEEAVA